jgi:hypothetical protein
MFFWMATIHGDSALSKKLPDAKKAQFSSIIFSRLM